MAKSKFFKMIFRMAYQVYESYLHNLGYGALGDCLFRCCACLQGALSLN